MCTWITAAPASRHSLAVVTSSSRVTGRAGTAAFSDSAPVGATVMRVAWPGRAVVLPGLPVALSVMACFAPSCAAAVRATAVYSPEFPLLYQVTQVPGAGGGGMPESGRCEQ